MTVFGETILDHAPELLTPLANISHHQVADDTTWLARI